MGRKTRISINPEVASECAARASESLQSNNICAPTRAASHCQWRISEKHNLNEAALTPLAAVPVTAAAPAGLRVAGGVGSQVYNWRFSLNKRRFGGVLLPRVIFPPASAS